MKKSILQSDTERCFICRDYARGDPLDRHHVFGGALRKKSEKYRLVVYLHHKSCHIFGKNSVHRNSLIDRAIKEYAQKRAMKRYKWTEQDFRNEFYKSYLRKEDESDT